MPANSINPLVSVILCTYNPRRDIMAMILNAIDGQSLDKSDYEVVVIDNNSSPALSAAEISEGRSFALRVVREERQGNVFARYRGIVEAKGDLIVFVDDDNVIYPDYLEKALHIARENPRLGAFGGKLLALLEEEIPEWKRAFLAYLGARDYGDKPITSNENCWGEWEPPTAGMAMRKEVGLEYVKFIDDFPEACQLGRKGQKYLLSCEDSLIARLAYPLGYYCSYQPALKLKHYMRKDRFRLGYLMRLMEGFGRSYVILERVLGRSFEVPSLLSSIIDLWKRVKLRIKTFGRAGFVIWFWDLGYYRQLRKADKFQ